jgi:hypothetical protein
VKGVKEKNLKWLSLIVVLVVSYAALNVARAPVTLPKVYVYPEETVYNPGDIFFVDIKIVDAEDVYSWGVKVRWDRDLLIATDAIEGDFLMYQPDGTAFVKKIYSDYVDVGCTTLGDWFGVSGSGTLMTIAFEVLEAGKTPLEIYYSMLLDSASPSVEIPHTVEDGYFYTTVAANLVKKSAWPEHHHFDVSAQLAKDGDSNQTLHSLVVNTGSAGYDLYVYVAFEIVRDDGIIAVPASDVVTVAAGEIVSLTADFGPLSDLDAGKHYVSASCWYSYTGTYWAQGEKIKTFSFAVVP